MKTGRSLHELAAEVSARAEQKRDYLINTNFLRFDTAEGRSQLLLPTQEPQLIPVSELAHRQIAERLNIPQKYYDRMREEEPRLLDANVNAWFLNKKEPRMLRTLNGQVRAFLSDKYRRIDHEDLAEAVLPSLSSLPDAEVVSCEITETRMYIKVINHALQSEVAPGDVIKRKESLKYGISNAMSPLYARRWALFLFQTLLARLCLFCDGAWSWGRFHSISCFHGSGENCFFYFHLI